MSSNQLSQPSIPASVAPLGVSSTQPQPKAAVDFDNETAPTRRTTVRRSAATRKLRHLLRAYHDWRSGHQYLGRYSVAKMLAFEDYCENTSALRVAAVLLLTPLPGLLAIVLIATVPLRSPLEGVASSGAYFVHSALSYVVMSVGLLLFVRRALGWPLAWYSHWQMALVAVVVSVSNELVFVAVSYAWRFPVPFRDLLGVPSYFALLGLTHVLIVGKSVFVRNREQLRRYLPLLSVQASTLFIFQGYAIAFEHVSTEGQIVLTVCFPLLKTAIKRMTWRFSTCLPDVATDVTICVAEIFGSLFLNVCIQNVRAPVVSAVIIAIDVAQSVFETRMYMTHKFIVDGRRALPTAVKIVEGALFPGSAQAFKEPIDRLSGSGKFSAALSQKGTSMRFDQTDAQPKSTSRSRSQSFNKVAIGGATIELGSIDSPTTAPTEGGGRSGRGEDARSMREVETVRRNSLMQSVTRRGSISVDDIEVKHKEHAKVLTQTLQLLFACEALSVAEYLEVAASATYVLYMLALRRLPYAQYNLSLIGLDAGEFRASLAAAAVYGALELASLGLMAALVRSKYGLNALYQLAFALEKYCMSVQGKFCGGFSLLFLLYTVHHGMDLSLEFDWEKVLKGPPHQSA